jgi:thiol-disulfide isomerase/thioredoxin
LLVIFSSETALMTDSPPAPSRNRAVNRAALALVSLLVLAGAGFLYVKESPSGKKADSGACAASAKITEAVKDLAKGEVAAMAIAKEPEPMANLAFKGPDGKPMTLADFKGKTLLLNLWATWCVPCRSEMPALDRLQAEAGSDRFEVVAINIDTSRLDRPKAFLDEVGVKALAYYADPKADIFFQLKQSGKVLGLPTTFLIDPLGCQLGLMAGPAAWDSAEGRALVTRAAEAAAGR